MSNRTDFYESPCALYISLSRGIRANSLFSKCDTSDHRLDTSDHRMYVDAYLGSDSDAKEELHSGIKAFIQVHNPI